MPAKKEKAIVIKPKVLEDTGYLLTTDGRQFIIAGGYKMKVAPFGEVAEWGGTIATLSEIPMDKEYLFSLQQEEDDRSGLIRLESVRQIKKGKITAYEYIFKGVTPLE